MIMYENFFEIAKTVRQENLKMSFYWDGGAGFCVSLTDLDSFRTFKSWNWVIEDAFSEAFEKLKNDRNIIEKLKKENDPKTIV